MLHCLSKTLINTKILLMLAISFSGASQADSLADIYELALINDPSLQAAEASYKAGREIKAQAISQLLPQINAGARYSESDTTSSNKQFFSESFSPPETNRDSDAETTVYSISLTQNLFNLSAFFAFKQSVALTQQAELQFSIDQQSLILRSANTYFNVLRSKDNLTSSLAEQKAIKQQLEQTQQRYDVGLIAITDVHEARAAFDLAVANRLTEEVSLGVAYENLAALTGQQHSNLFNLSDDFKTNKPEPSAPEAWVKFAADNNLHIQLAEQIANASSQNAKVKKFAHAPTVQAVLRYDDSTSDTSSSDNILNNQIPDTFSNFKGSTVEVRLNMPIWEGGFKHSQRRQAGYEQVRDQANLVAAKRTAFREARSSYLTTVADTARVNARKLAITSALSALDATQAGYDAGTRNVVDLLNAQRDLFRAQRDHANTRYDYVINSLKLKQAAGILSPQDIYDLNKWLVAPAAALKSETAGELIAD
jgi:outer membrane protein